MFTCRDHAAELASRMCYNISFTENWHEQIASQKSRGSYCPTKKNRGSSALEDPFPRLVDHQQPVGSCVGSMSINLNVTTITTTISREKIGDGAILFAGIDNHELSTMYVCTTLQEDAPILVVRDAFSQTRHTPPE